MRTLYHLIFSFGRLLELTELDILKRPDNGYFYPHRNITRAEFTAILARLSEDELNIEDNGQVFTDVNASHWYAPYAVWAKQTGIVYGVNGQFLGDNSITRQEAVVMISRYINIYKLEYPDTVDPIKFADENEIADWALEAVYKCSQAGLICGYDGRNFAPLSLITRGESAHVMRKLLAPDIFNWFNPEDYLIHGVSLWQ